MAFSRRQSWRFEDQNRSQTRSDRPAARGPAGETTRSRNPNGPHPKCHRISGATKVCANLDGIDRENARRYGRVNRCRCRIVELAAVAYCDMIEVRAEMLKIGRAVKGRQSTIIKNPLCTEYARAADRYFRLLVECGLSPSARTRLSVTPAETEDDVIGDLMRELGHNVN